MGIRALLSTLPYKMKADAEGEIYRRYMAKCAKAITENTARLCGGVHMTASYDEIIEPTRPETAADERTSDEIISSVREKLGRMSQKE